MDDQSFRLGDNGRYLPMRFSLLKLFLALTVFGLLAWRLALYLEDTSGRLQGLGVQCQIRDDIHIIGLGTGFDREKLEQVVRLIGRLKTPCSLSVTGKSLADKDISSLHSLSNLTDIYFGETLISNAGLLTLAEIDGLERVTIERCKNIDNSGVLQLEAIRPDLTFKGWWIESRTNGAPPKLTGR